MIGLNRSRRILAASRAAESRRLWVQREDFRTRAIPNRGTKRPREPVSRSYGYVRTADQPSAWPCEFGNGAMQWNSRSSHSTRQHRARLGSGGGLSRIASGAPRFGEFITGRSCAETRMSERQDSSNRHCDARSAIQSNPDQDSTDAHNGAVHAFATGTGTKAAPKPQSAQNAHGSGDSEPGAGDLWSGKGPCPNRNRGVPAPSNPRHCQRRKRSSRKSPEE